MNRILSFTICLLFVRNAFGGVFYKSVDRAISRTSSALRTAEISEDLKQRLQRTSESMIKYIEARDRCEVSVCFAFEGSAEITPAVYRLQQLFSFLISAIISADNTATFSALQYATTTNSVISLTGDFYKFLDEVGYTRPENSDDLINMSAALATCTTKVRADESKNGIVIIIGSGRSNIGFSPDTVADVVLQTTSIIAASTSGDSRLFSESLGIRERDVINISSLKYFEDAIKKVVAALC